MSYSLVIVEVTHDIWKIKKINFLGLIIGGDGIKMQE